MKKIILILSLLIFISCTENKEKKVIIKNNNSWLLVEQVCSPGLTNLMSEMGLMAYDMADFMSGMCSMMPFGGMCPDLGDMAAKFFSEVLEHPQLTLDLLDCADVNQGMRSFMLKIMAEHRWLLIQIAEIMKQNQNESACLFTEKFTVMSITHEDLRDFFFYFVDNNLYRSLTYANLCDNNTANNVSILMRDYGAEEMQPGHSFGEVFMNLGSVDNSNDGNEMSNERLFYSMFTKIESANNFFAALANMPQEMGGAFMNFFFMGIQNIPALNCTPQEERQGCVPREAITLNHEDQGYYNLYAIINAFYNKIAPLYDIDLPPDPNSENEANALFGSFMKMLITEDGEMTPFATQFFSAIVTAASPPHCNPEAQGMMGMLESMMEKGFIPFTVEQFQAMAPDLYNVDAPAPRDFLDGSGDIIVGVCPDLECTQETPQGCATLELCEAANLSWCGEYCSSECPSCDNEHLTLCTDESSCSSANGFFCDNSCVAESCEEVLHCNNDNLSLCFNQRSCIEANGYWCTNVCNSQECEDVEDPSGEGDNCSYYYPCSENLACYRTFGEQYERCVIPAAEDESCENFYPCKEDLVCEFNHDSRDYTCKRLKGIGESCEWNRDCELYLSCDYREKVCVEY